MSVARRIVIRRNRGCGAGEPVFAEKRRKAKKLAFVQKPTVADAYSEVAPARPDRLAWSPLVEQSDIDMMEWLLEEIEVGGKRLTGWEIDFIESLASRMTRMGLTARQQEVLGRIFDKLGG